MTADARLALIQAKITWAKQHIGDLDREITAFLKTNPYKIGTKLNPETRKLTYYVAAVEEAPPSIALRIGDAVQCLRSALDHLVHQLHEVAGTGTPPKDRGFPIADDAHGYESQRGTKMKGLPQAVVQAIDAIKPYKTGDPSNTGSISLALWRLHQLNNIDKHRALLTCGSVFGGVDIGAIFARVAQRSQIDFVRRAKIGQWYLRESSPVFPLKVGNELFTDAPNEEANEKMSFIFTIAFGEPGVVEGESPVKFLHDMANVVEKLSSAFRPFLG